MRDFQGAIGYKNQPMVERYARRNNVTVEYADHLFEECKRFLVTGAIMRRPISPSKELDEMWHHFILHTSAYADWCEKFVGHFVHHNPTETPEIGTRSDMLETATKLFGTLDLKLWPGTGITACDSSCSGDAYCSESIKAETKANCTWHGCSGGCDHGCSADEVRKAKADCTACQSCNGEGVCASSVQVQASA